MSKLTQSRFLDLESLGFNAYLAKAEMKKVDGRRWTRSQEDRTK